MALINCPECDKEVSDKANVCIHCGYPLNEFKSETILDSQSKKVVIPSFKEYSDKKIHVIKVIRETTGMDLSGAVSLVEQDIPIVKDGLSYNQAKEIADKFLKIEVEAKIFDSATTLTYVNPSKDKDKICCPKCGSLEYHTGSRGYSLFAGFIGSGKVVMTCLRCGNRWKPNN